MFFSMCSFVCEFRHAAAATSSKSAVSNSQVGEVHHKITIFAVEVDLSLQKVVLFLPDIHKCVQPKVSCFSLFFCTPISSI